MTGEVDPPGDETAAPDSALSRASTEDIRTVAGGGAVQIIGQITGRGLAFLFVAVAVRVLSTSEFGVYRLVAQVLTVAGLVGLCGLNYATMRGITRARAGGDHGGVVGTARAGLVAASITSVALAVLVFLSAHFIAERFGEFDPDRVAFLLRVGCLYIPLFALMQVLRYCTQAYKTMVPSVAVGNIIQPVVRFVLGVAVLLGGLGVTGAISTLVASVGVAVIAGFLYLIRIFSPEEREARPHADLSAMFRFALPQAGSSLLSFQSLGGGLVVLGLAGATPADVGLFGIALALQGPGTVFLGGVVNIWAPMVTELSEKRQIARLGSLYQTVNRWIATFSFPVFAALVIEPDLFVDVLAGPKGAGAAGATAILAAGNVFYTGTGPTGYVISMSGYPVVNLLNSIAGVAAYFGLGLWLVPKHGIVAMAVIDSSVTAAINLARVIEAKLLIGIQPFGRTFLKPVAATLAGSAVLLAWKLVPGDGIALRIAGVAVAGLAYVAVLWMLGIDPEEAYVWRRIKTRASKVRRPRHGR